MRYALRPRAVAAACACVLYFSAAGVSSARQTPVTGGQVLISELRWRGPGRPVAQPTASPAPTPNRVEDEFVEIYNNTDQEIVVQATDGSGGWAVAASNGQFTSTLFVIPNGTRIPARGHFLGANSNGYSLGGYPSGNPDVPPVTCPPSCPLPSPTPQLFAAATPDATWAFDVPDGSGVALFSTSDPANMSGATKLDAFGYTNTPSPYREGTGFPAVVRSYSEHAYYRDLRGGLPKDTNDNAADFLLVGTPRNIQVRLLGAPGPENLRSPVVNNAGITGRLLDPAASASSPPNRERINTPETNADFGTLRVRRTFTNNTGSPVTRLRFRVVNITTAGTPDSECGGTPCADLRALTSQDGVVTLSNQTPVLVRGVRLEENPPLLPQGGGYNSSLSADFINLSQPLLPGASVNIEFKLGVMRDGPFRFLINIEAQSATD
ncbi:MAG TPA: hypothetical protein VD968_09305 [Pyrinomonadaceae bacterium]|nr:hypothetical protein [Pyrinomonadaceae bacterium]